MIRVTLMFRILFWIQRRDKEGIDTSSSTVYDYWSHQEHNGARVTREDVTQAIDHLKDLGYLYDDGKEL